MSNRNYERCFHFTGIQHDECAAGVNYRGLAGNPEFGMVKRIPCTNLHDGNPVVCELYRKYTQEEIDDQEKEFEDASERMRLVSPIIGQVKEDHKGESWGGTVECPCCQGQLHLSHAAVNGHVWGQCETEGCLNWME